MATRTLFWRRNANISFDWTAGPQGTGKHLFYVNQGETLLRLILSVRLWASTTANTNVTPERLYVPYSFAVLYDDGSIPTLYQMTPANAAVQAPQAFLHLESYSMRDAWTPAKYSGVNLGWIDDRAEQTFEIRSSRLGRQAAPDADEIFFSWGGISTLYGDPLSVSPRVSASALFAAPLGALPSGGT